MPTILQQFKTWIFESRSFIFSWYTKDRNQTQEPTKSLVELPASIRQELVAATNKLPDNPTDIEAIRTSIDKAFEEWRDRPTSTNNSIVILTSPVMVVSRAIIDLIEDWSTSKQVKVKILPWNDRPVELNSIQSKLQQYLNREPAKIAEGQTELVVIPHLSWCFLRSMDGLDGIDYLQQMLLHEADRFWVIAAGQITWDYLNSITDIEADCGRVFALPKLNGKDLQQWFQPVVDRLQISFANPSLESKILEGDKDAESIYFEDLASVSKGVSVIALNAFLASISYEPPDGDEERGVIQAESPELPNLPTLESMDHYILYFILLHGDITLSALAHSIGDRESRIRKRIRFLREEGLVEEDEEILKVNPIYYPKLKQELTNNNFVIKEPE